MKRRAHFIFPIPEDKDQELLTITGTEKAIRDAQSKLHTLITNLDKAVEDKILINPMYHQQFFVQRSQVLQVMPEEYGGVIIQENRVTKSQSKEQYLVLKQSRNIFRRLLRTWTMKSQQNVLFPRSSIIF